MSNLYYIKFKNIGHKYGIYLSHLFTVLLSVFILKNFIFLNNDDKFTGFIFLTLSYLSPAIIISNFGLKQIIVLQKIKFIPIDLILFRIFFFVILFIGSSFIIPSKYYIIFSMMCFWKLSDSLTETIHSKLIYEQKYLKLAFFSLFRLVIIFLIHQFVSFFSALLIGYSLYIAVLLYDNNIKFNYNLRSIVSSGTILSLGALFSSLGSALPRVLVEYHYGMKALASVGAALYMAGLLSNIIGPFQNKLRVELTNNDSKTFKIIYKKLKKPLIEIYLIIFLMLFPILILFDHIKQFLFGVEIVLNRLDFVLIYVGFMMFSILGFLDLVCQVINKFHEILIMRILIIVFFIISFTILSLFNDFLAFILFLMYVITTCIVIYIQTKRIYKWF
jgi:hypothetical protein